MTRKKRTEGVKKIVSSSIAPDSFVARGTGGGVGIAGVNDSKALNKMHPIKRKQELKKLSRKFNSNVKGSLLVTQQPSHATVERTFHDQSTRPKLFNDIPKIRRGGIEGGFLGAPGRGAGEGIRFKDDFPGDREVRGAKAVLGGKWRRLEAEKKALIEKGVQKGELVTVDKGSNPVFKKQSKGGKSKAKEVGKIAKGLTQPAPHFKPNKKMVKKIMQQMFKLGPMGKAASAISKLIP